MMFIQSMFLSMIGIILWANSSYWPHVYFADINTFSDVNRIYIARKVQATRSAVALLFWQRWRKWRKISRVIQIQIDIGQTFLKQWQQYRIDKYHSGFYLGFIVWGRSPEWPKATCFLGGSGVCLPEIFWNEYALRCNLCGAFWDTILRNFTVWEMTSSGLDDFPGIITHIL